MRCHLPMTGKSNAAFEIPIIRLLYFYSILELHRQEFIADSPFEPCDF